MIDFTAYRLSDGTVYRELSGSCSAGCVDFTMGQPLGSEARLTVQDVVCFLAEDAAVRWVTVDDLIVRLGPPRPRYTVDDAPCSYFLEEIVLSNAYAGWALTDDEKVAIGNLLVGESATVGAVEVRRLS